MSSRFPLPPRPENPRDKGDGPSLPDFDFFSPSGKQSAEDIQKKDALSDFDFGTPSTGPSEEITWELPDTSPARQEQESFAPVAPSSRPVAPSLSNLDIETVETTEDRIDLDDLLLEMLSRGGSDLHLSANAYPMVRVNGDLTPMDAFPRLTGEIIKDTIHGILNKAQRNTFENELELDLAYTIPGKSRFRVNVFQQQGNMGAVLRAIPWEIKTFEELNLSPTLEKFVNLPRGLVLVTGPTGSGKSTTLAAIIDKINRTKPHHIMTVEDPIEFVHEHQMSLINQREVGSDTHSFGAALKHVLREDPDVILVGEMRDLETISIAITAAETGHLVFGTLHTQSAQETITRIIDVFPEGSKAQVRTQLAASIQGIVCQTLLKRQDTKGRIAAQEILIGTDSVRALIREGKLQQIQSAMQTGGHTVGMQTLNSALEELVRAGKVDPYEAADKATNRQEFINTLGGEQGIKDIQRKNRNQQTGGFF